MWLSFWRFSYPSSIDWDEMLKSKSVDKNNAECVKTIHVQPLYTVQYCTWFKNQDRQQRKICHHSETTASRVYINNYSIIVRNKTYRYRKYLDRKRINVAVMNFILDCYKKVSGLVTKIYTLYYNSSSR